MQPTKEQRRAPRRYGDDNSVTQHSDALVASIARRHREGATATELANEFGLKWGVIRYLLYIRARHLEEFKNETKRPTRKLSDIQIKTICEEFPFLKGGERRSYAKAFGVTVTHIYRILKKMRAHDAT